MSRGFPQIYQLILNKTQKYQLFWCLVPKNITNCNFRWESIFDKDMEFSRKPKHYQCFLICYPKISFLTNILPKGITLGKHLTQKYRTDPPVGLCAKCPPPWESTHRVSNLKCVLPNATFSWRWRAARTLKLPLSSDSAITRDHQMENSSKSPLTHASMQYKLRALTKAGRSSDSGNLFPQKYFCLKLHKLKLPLPQIFRPFFHILPYCYDTGCPPIEDMHDDCIILCHFYLFLFMS